MPLFIGPIVEGQTEQRCVERLLHRTWEELLGQGERLQVMDAFRVPRDRLVHPKGQALAETAEKAFLKLRASCSREEQARMVLLILLDAEGDCPKALSSALLQVARQTVPAELPIACVLAKRMFENWIVAGASTLATVCGLPDPVPARFTVENLSGAAWLDAQIRGTGSRPTLKYDKTAHALRLVQRMDLAECRANAPSFDKLCRELERRIAPPVVTTVETDPPTE